MEKRMPVEEALSPEHGVYAPGCVRAFREPRGVTVVIGNQWRCLEAPAAQKLLDDLRAILAAPSVDTFRPYGSPSAPG